MAFGAAARELQRRLLREPGMERLMGVATHDGLVVFGPDLPWVDGGRYVAPDPEASALWTPTVWAPSVPIGLLERAILRRCPMGAAPVVLIDERVIPLGPARPLHADTLAAAVR